MDGPALIEHFVLGHQVEVDAAWATLEDVLPYFRVSPANGYEAALPEGDAEIQRLWRDVCFLGWQHPAPAPDH